LRKDESLTEQEKNDYLRISSEKGGELFKLIQEFSELARLEEEQETLSLRKIDIAELVRTVLLDFYFDFTKLNISPIIKIPDYPVFINGNADALHRVFNNLISNALRYGADGKEIGVIVRQEMETVYIDVWDNGKGITPENLSHIFERLYTPETSRNATLRGTGLGLTIAKALIEKQGGQIKAGSVPNKKTVFTVGFPLFRKI
jgi:signal transduction histidine kinase